MKKTPIIGTMIFILVVSGLAAAGPLSFLSSLFSHGPTGMQTADLTHGDASEDKEENLDFDMEKMKDEKMDKEENLDFDMEEMKDEKMDKEENLDFDMEMMKDEKMDKEENLDFDMEMMKDEKRERSDKTRSLDSKLEERLQKLEKRVLELEKALKKCGCTMDKTIEPVEFGPLTHREKNQGQCVSKCEEERQQCKKDAMNEMLTYCKKLATLDDGSFDKEKYESCVKTEKEKVEKKADECKKQADECKSKCKVGEKEDKENKEDKEDDKKPAPKLSIFSRLFKR